MCQEHLNIELYQVNILKALGMCGRFSLGNVKAINLKYDLNIVPNYNISPSAHILLKTDRVFNKKWLFSPNWAPKPLNLINARYETLKQKLSFRNAKRCGVFSSGWFEWKRTGKVKEPFFHYLKDEYFFLGGIFNDTGCAIVTIESEGILRNIHHRRPVFFSKNSLDFWLRGQDEELFKCNSPNRLGIHLVSKKVNSGIINDKELVEAIE